MNKLQGNPEILAKLMGDYLQNNPIPKEKIPHIQQRLINDFSDERATVRNVFTSEYLKWTQEKEQTKGSSHIESDDHVESQQISSARTVNGINYLWPFKTTSVSSRATTNDKVYQLK